MKHPVKETVSVQTQMSLCLSAIKEAHTCNTHSLLINMIGASIRRKIPKKLCGLKHPSSLSLCGRDVAQIHFNAADKKQGNVVSGQRSRWRRFDVLEP